MIFVSTTYYNKGSSNLKEALLELSKLDIDGIEIGSTHKYDSKNNYKNFIKKIKSKKIFIHNFFPPTRNSDFLINISSSSKKIREDSVNIIINNIDFCKEVGALLYTIHPGFLSEGVPQSNFKKKDYNFNFSKKKLLHKNDGFDFMKNSLKKITKYASLKKIKLAIETEGSMRKKEFLLMQTPDEYKKIFNEIPNNLYINLNIAHTYFASLCYKFSIKNFIKLINTRIEAVELSCNNGLDDQHMPLSINSKNLTFLKLIKNKTIILEFRNSSLDQIKNSIELVRRTYGN
jgi:sugar phosphate isomerase/epimerase